MNRSVLRLFGRPSRSAVTSRRPVRTRALRLEPLEERNLLSVTIDFTSNILKLTFNGTPASETLSLREDSGKLYVATDNGTTANANAQAAPLSFSANTAANVENNGTINTADAASNTGEVWKIEIVGSNAAGKTQKVLVNGGTFPHMTIDNEVEEVRFVTAASQFSNLSNDSDASAVPSLEVDATDTMIGQNLSTEGGKITMQTAVTLLGDVTLDTDKTGGNGNAGDVELKGEVNATAAGAQKLTIDTSADNKGSDGKVTLEKALGQTTSLGDVEISAGIQDVTLKGNLFTDGGKVTIRGTMPVAANLVIDTEDGGVKNAGAVDLSEARVIDTGGGVYVVVDTSTGVGHQAGAVSLPPAYVNQGKQTLKGASYVLFQNPSLTTQFADIYVSEEAYKSTVDKLFADFGDAPDQYLTALADDGPRHQISGNSLYLGQWRDQDPEAGVAGTPDADGDDVDFIADEDGVKFLTPLAQGEAAQIEVTASADGWLNAWVDFGLEAPAVRTFGADDKLFGGGRFLPAGTSTISLQVPANAVLGDTYARFRFSSVDDLDPKGFAPDGEVEDYKVAIVPPETDYGDAPTAAQSGFASSYPTLVADNGASHVVGGPVLGTIWDSEDDGQPTPGADGDDLTDDDDADGVTFDTPLALGLDAQFTVTNTGGGKLDAWIDYNANGDWSDAGEKVVDSDVLTDGVAKQYTVTVPDTATVGDTYARFRLSTAGGLNPDGAASDGEVEDYLVSILSVIDFNDYAIQSYGDTVQDKPGGYQIQDGGRTLYLSGCHWKKIDINYAITPQTVLEFDFKTDTPGEIHGIGFDTDLMESANRTFRLDGTQDWGMSDYYRNPVSTDPVTGLSHYQIPVGAYYTGQFNFLFFINDRDAGDTQQVDSYFSNVQVYES